MIISIVTIYPPPQVPSVLSKEKEAYQFWISLHRDFPRIERSGIGKKIDSIFLDLLEYTLTSSYLPIEQKIILLSKTISKLDILKFFMQIAWESKLIHTERYSLISEQLEEIGRQLGGWKRGLQSKTLTRL